MALWNRYQAVDEAGFRQEHTFGQCVLGLTSIICEGRELMCARI